MPWTGFPIAYLATGAGHERSDSFHQKSTEMCTEVGLQPRFRPPTGSPPLAHAPMPGAERPADLCIAMLPAEPSPDTLFDLGRFYGMQRPIFASTIEIPANQRGQSAPGSLFERLGAPRTPSVLVAEYATPPSSDIDRLACLLKAARRNISAIVRLSAAAALASPRCAVAQQAMLHEARPELGHRPALAVVAAEPDKLEAVARICGLLPWLAKH